MSVYVLFEVTLSQNRKEEYFELAANLKESLARAEGFIRSERFESTTSSDRLLSLSVWENEDSITAWRNLNEHRQCQQMGRGGIFSDYSITVLSSEQRLYGMNDRAVAPEDSADFCKEKNNTPQFTAKHHALMFSFLCESIENKIGDTDETKAFLIETTKAYARNRGERMRKRAIENGNVPSAKTYQAYSEIPAPLTGSKKITHNTGQGVETVTLACPWYDAWVEGGFLRYAKIFCAYFDATLADTFCSEACMEVPTTLSNGDDKCVFLYPGTCFSDQDFAEVDEMKSSLNGKEMRPFEFHVFDLVQVFHRELSSAYGYEIADEIMSDARARFSEEFSERADSEVGSSI